jgi:hypothetical protein
MTQETWGDCDFRMLKELNGVTTEDLYCLLHKFQDIVLEHEHVLRQDIRETFEDFLEKQQALLDPTALEGSGM